VAVDPEGGSAVGPEGGSAVGPGAVATSCVWVGWAGVHSRCRAHSHVGEKGQEGVPVEVASLVYEDFRCSGMVVVIGDIRQEAITFRREPSLGQCLRLEDLKRPPA
jgi:hypothetical protein